MELWDKLRNYFYQKNIVEKLAGSNAKRAITNLQNAKAVGIIYNSTNPDNDIIITKFAEDLRKQGKSVEILGFVNDTKIDHKADILVFNKKCLSWTQIPKDDRVEKFSERNFDLLFAAFVEENFPLEYVARISKAKWRVGNFEEKKTDYYELMINLSGKNDVQYFLQQATYFLNQINYDNK